MPSLARAEVYTAGQAAQAAGLRYHQLDQWSNAGIVVPTIQKANGTETCRAYSFSDVVALAVGRRLREVGFGLGAVADAARYLQRRNRRTLGALSMIAGVDDGRVIAGDLDEIVAAARRAKSVCWTVNISAVVTDVGAALKDIGQPKRGKARKVAGCLTAVG